MADPAGELARLLAAVAASPQLDGVLLLDAPPETLRAASRHISGLLRDADGREPRVLLLGSQLTDDELWSRLVVRQDDDGRRRLWPAPGFLVQLADDPVVLVLIPDLARLSVAARRALVALLDSPVAYMERHGQHRAWRPRLKWLAGCESAAVGDVSRHILDRFAVRFTAGRLAGDVDTVTARAATPHEQAPHEEDPRSQEAAERALPQFPSEAIARANEYFPAAPSTRRVIALSRLARALARLDAAASVTAGYVDEAAGLMSLVPLVPADRAQEEPADEEDKAAQPAPPSQQSLLQEIVDLLKSPAGFGRPPSKPAAAPAREVIGGVSEPLAQTELPVAGLTGVPYPEDAMSGLAEAPLLTLADRRADARPAAEGPVVGTRAATGPRDLAWVPTLVEAAKFQAVRRRFRRDPARQGSGLILSPTDLRAHRRSRRTDSLLVLVLDHTCLRDTDATNLLASYLYWAYTQRAAVTVIEVGAAGATFDQELRATARTARSVQDPGVQAALRRPGGKATPLAHGLRLALDALRRAGRDPVAQAWLVVVTDGLANVPLAASLSGSVRLPWSGSGVDDALAAASGIASFKWADAVLIAPPRVPHPELPARLAAAMGAGLIRGAPALPVLAAAAGNEAGHAT
jgi:magnesium chelatase subunit D